MKTIKHIDGSGNERELEEVGTCADGTTLYREKDSNGVAGDNADGIRLFSDLESYLSAIPESDRREVSGIFQGADGSEFAEPLHQ